MEINYEYNPLWTAFRPTLWVWSIALVGSAIFIISRRHGAPETVALPSGVTRLRPENLKTSIRIAPVNTGNPRRHSPAFLKPILTLRVKIRQNFGSFLFADIPRAYLIMV
jgi:hypothetical protein